MNIKLKALLLTGGFFAFCVLFAVAVEWIFTSFSAAQLAFGFQAICVSALVYAVYGLILARLEMEKSLKKLSDSL